MEYSKRETISVVIDEFQEFYRINLFDHVRDCIWTDGVLADQKRGGRRDRRFPAEARTRLSPHSKGAPDLRELQGKEFRL